MNVFILDTNPHAAAKMQCDKHVVKMCLETAQILSTITGGPYKPTHANHPCTLWAKANRTHFNWGQLKKFLKQPEFSPESKIKIMKNLFKVPQMYKEWFDFSKRCGITVQLELKSEKYKKLTYTNFFEKQPDCQF